MKTRRPPTSALIALAFIGVFRPRVRRELAANMYRINAGAGWYHDRHGEGWFLDSSGRWYDNNGVTAPLWFNWALGALGLVKAEKQ